MKLRWLLIGLCLILFSLLLPNNLIAIAEPNASITYHVTGTADVNPPWTCTARADGGSDCPSLRAAVIAANSHPGWDTILLQHNTTYQLTIPMTSTDRPQTGDLDITQHLTFGYTNICFFNCGATIQGGPNFNDRVLEVYAGIRVDMTKVTVRGGKNTVYDGGGIYNAGILTLTHSTVYNNQADKGGGILNVPDGMLTLVGSTVTSNTARVSDGGGLFNAGSLYLIDSLIEKNFAPDRGGGLYNHPDRLAVIQGGLISGNISGIWVGNMGHGGGVYNDGQLIMTDTQIVSNSARHMAAAFSNGNTGVGTLTGVTMERNLAGQDAYGFGASGGCLEVRGRLTLDRVAILSNTAEIVGGVWMEAGSALTMTHSRIAGNVAAGMSGGMYVSWNAKAIIEDSEFLSNTSAEKGGGIFIDGAVMMTGSLMSGNQSNNGGAIDNAGIITLVNSTLSGNFANNEGGGFYTDDAFSVARFNNVTIVNNLANADANATGQGGGLRVVTGTVQVFNTLIAQNSDWGLLNRPDCSGSLTLAAYDLIQNTTGCTLPASATGLITGQAAQIGSLKDNGGSTWTHALELASPARKAGQSYANGPVLISCPKTDQRGVSRPSASRCDLGAFELVQRVYFPVVMR